VSVRIFLAALTEARDADRHEELRELDDPIPPLETTHDHVPLHGVCRPFRFEIQLVHASAVGKCATPDPRPRP
jgi:hypothetical protein